MRDSGGRFFYGLPSYGSLFYLWFFPYGPFLWFFSMVRGFSFYGCLRCTVSCVFLSPRRGELC
jgi:hypothetical protein